MNKCSVACFFDSQCSYYNVAAAAAATSMMALCENKRYYVFTSCRDFVQKNKTCTSHSRHWTSRRPATSQKKNLWMSTASHGLYGRLIIAKF